MQWADTALPTPQHRPCAAVGQGDPGRCRSPQQHASQVPGLPHPAGGFGRANRPPQGRINFAIWGGARPTPDEMLSVTSDVALQIETASPSIAARNLPPLRHCETGSASPAISACRQHPGKRAVWKIAMAGYGASCPPTLTLRCCRKRRSRPSPIDLTAHPVNAWAIALRMRFWESRSPFSRPDKFCRPGWGSPHPG